MKTARKILTSKFEEQKKNFEIYDSLDEHIESFILQLNENENIVTSYSCEGANSEAESIDGHSVWAYFGMNVSKAYWDFIWVTVIPDLIMVCDVKISTNSNDESIFFHAVSAYQKYDFWDAVFKTFKKHNIIKEYENVHN